MPAEALLEFGSAAWASGWGFGLDLIWPVPTSHPILGVLSNFWSMKFSLGLCLWIISTRILACLLSYMTFTLYSFFLLPSFKIPALYSGAAKNIIVNGVPHRKAGKVGWSDGTGTPAKAYTREAKVLGISYHKYGKKAVLPGTRLAQYKQMMCVFVSLDYSFYS